MGILRICHSKNIDTFLEIRSHTNDRLKFDGVLSPIGETVQSIISYKFDAINITFDLNKGIGKQVDGEYFDGCIGMLQRNLTDVPLFTHNYPNNINYIDQGQLMYEDAMGILSVFMGGNEKIDNSILNSLMNFDLKIWLSCFICIFFCCLILLLEKNLFRSFSNFPLNRKILVALEMYQDLLEHFIGQIVVKRKTLVSSIIIFTISLLAQMVNIHFDTTVRTDLVTVNEPRLIRTYDDIIKYGIKPIWTANFLDMLEFKTAREGSPEAKLWAYAMDKFGVKGSIFSASSKEFANHLVQVIKGKDVFISTLTVLGVLVRSVCSKKSRSLTVATAFLNVSGNVLDKAQSYQASDPSSKILQQTLLYNKLTMNNEPLRTLVKRIRRLVETGITIWFHEKIKSVDILKRFEESLGPVIEKRRFLSHQCLTNKISTASDDHLEDLNLESTRKLFQLFFNLILMCSWILLIERTCLRIKCTGRIINPVKVK